MRAEKLSLRTPYGVWQSVFLLRELRILSCFALRMTDRLVVANVVWCAVSCCSVIAKPCKRLWQSVFPLPVIASAVRRAAIRFFPFLIEAETDKIIDKLRARCKAELLFIDYFFSNSLFIISGPCSTNMPVFSAFFSVNGETPFLFLRLS